MANASLLNYKQLAERLYSDLDDYTQTQTKSDLYKNSDKVNTSYLKANFYLLDEVVFGLRQDGFTVKAKALEDTIQDARKAVKNHDEGETKGTTVKLYVAHLIRELEPLCRPKPPTETGQENKAINKPNRNIFDDTLNLPWIPSINYKNFWYKIKNWPCMARGIEKIRKLFRR